MAVYYPPIGFYFKVNFQGIDGVTDTDFRFQEVSGLNVDVEVEEIKDGAVPQYSYKVPKRIKYPNLVLKRGLLKDSALISWFENALDSYFNVFNYSFSPCTIMIMLIDASDSPVASWQINNAFPVKWDMSNLNAKNNEIVIETIEFAYLNFKRL